MIESTEAMVADQGFRADWTMQENAPSGHATVSRTLYRCWLAALAKIAGAIKGWPTAVMAEPAALLWSGPILLILTIAAGSIMVSIGWGGGAAWVWIVATAAAGPFALAFAPGCADDRSLAALALVIAIGFALIAFARRIPGWLGFCLAALALALAAWTAVIPRSGVPHSQPFWGVWASPTDESHRLTGAASDAIVERDLGHWLASHAGDAGAVVFAPPQESAGLEYYGGLRVLGTFAPDNQKGFGATLTIGAEPTLDGVERLLAAKDVAYIVLPSWDPFFEDFAARYLPKAFAGRKSPLVERLKEGPPPLWLRALAYQVPVAGGYAGQSVAVFQVVPDQTPASAAARYAEYLIEMGRLREAAAFAGTLARFRGDLGALAAAAQVANATNDSGAFAGTIQAIEERLAAGGDRYMPWDRRVSLTLALAEAGNAELARREAERCFGEATAERLREESAASLYSLLVVGRAFGLQLGAPALRGMARDLLPEGMRGSL